MRPDPTPRPCVSRAEKEGMRSTEIIGKYRAGDRVITTRNPRNSIVSLDDGRELRPYESRAVVERTEVNIIGQPEHGENVFWRRS